MQKPMACNLADHTKVQTSASILSQLEGKKYWMSARKCLNERIKQIGRNQFKFIIGLETSMFVIECHIGHPKPYFRHHFPNYMTYDQSYLQSLFYYYVMLQLNTRFLLGTEFLH